MPAGQQIHRLQHPSRSHRAVYVVATNGTQDFRSTIEENLPVDAWYRDDHGLQRPVVADTARQLETFAQQAVKTATKKTTISRERDGGSI
jgi:hypothetical protein